MRQPVSDTFPQTAAVTLGEGTYGRRGGSATLETQRSVRFQSPIPFPRKIIRSSSRGCVRAVFWVNKYQDAQHTHVAYPTTTPQKNKLSAARREPEEPGLCRCCLLGLLPAGDPNTRGGVEPNDTQRGPRSIQRVIQTAEFILT